MFSGLYAMYKSIILCLFALSDLIKALSVLVKLTVYFPWPYSFVLLALQAMFIEVLSVTIMC